MKVAVIPKDSEEHVPGILSIEVALADALEGAGEDDALNDHLEGSEGGEEGEVEVVVEIVPRGLAGVEGVSDGLPHGKEWSEDGETGGGSEHGIDEIRVREEAGHQPSHANGEIVCDVGIEPGEVRKSPDIVVKEHPSPDAEGCEGHRVDTVVAKGIFRVKVTESIFSDAFETVGKTRVDSSVVTHIQIVYNLYLITHIRT